MTHIKRFILVLCLVCAVSVLFCVPAFAEEITETTPVITETSTSSNTNVNVFVVGDSGATYDESGNEIPWTAGGSGDSLLESLFGAYTPYAASGVAAVDWAWIADVVVFTVMLVCFFKIVGGVIKRV